MAKIILQTPYMRRVVFEGDKIDTVGNQVHIKHEGPNGPTLVAVVSAYEWVAFANAVVLKPESTPEPQLDPAAINFDRGDK